MSTLLSRRLLAAEHFSRGTRPPIGALDVRLPQVRKRFTALTQSTHLSPVLPQKRMEVWKLSDLRG